MPLYVIVSACGAAAMFGFYLSGGFTTAVISLGSYGFVYGPSGPLLDVLVLAALGTQRELYGRQRLAGSLGWAVGAAGVGALVPDVDDDDDEARLLPAGLRSFARLAGAARGDEEEHPPYEILPLLVAIGIASAGALAWLLLRRDAKRAEAGSVAWRDLGRFVAERNVWLCCVNVLIIGLCEAGTNLFAFPYLQDELGAPPLVLGLMKVAAVSGELVVLAAAPVLLAP